MLLQMLFVGFVLVLLGSVTCLAVFTDPNEQPNPQRQRLRPVGLAMLFGGVGALGSIFGFDYFGETLDSYLELPWWLGGVVFPGGYGLSVIGGARIGFLMGRRRNTKLNY